MGVAKQLVALESRKSFLGEFCASLMCQLLSACPEEVCRDGLLRELRLDGGWESCTTERLHVGLHASKLYGKVWCEGSLVRDGEPMWCVDSRRSGLWSSSRSTGPLNTCGVARTLTS